MTNLEKCNQEVREVLRKYGCKLKVCALLETDGISFKVDTVYATEEGKKPKGRKPKHQGTDALRPTPEAIDSDSDEQGRKS